jgi:hypothetical protein
VPLGQLASGGLSVTYSGKKKKWRAAYNKVHPHPETSSTAPSATVLTHPLELAVPDFVLVANVSLIS